MICHETSTAFGLKLVHYNKDRELFGLSRVLFYSSNIKEASSKIL